MKIIIFILLLQFSNAVLSEEDLGYKDDYELDVPELFIYETVGRTLVKITDSLYKNDCYITEVKLDDDYHTFAFSLGLHGENTIWQYSGESCIESGLIFTKPPKTDEPSPQLLFTEVGKSITDIIMSEPLYNGSKVRVIVNIDNSKLCFLLFDHNKIGWFLYGSECTPHSELDNIINENGFIDLR